MFELFMQSIFLTTQGNRRKRQAGRQEVTSAPMVDLILNFIQAKLVKDGQLNIIVTLLLMHEIFSHINRRMLSRGQRGNHPMKDCVLVQNNYMKQAYPIWSSWSWSMQMQSLSTTSFVSYVWNSVVVLIWHFELGWIGICVWYFSETTGSKKRNSYTLRYPVAYITTRD